MDTKSTGRPDNPKYEKVKKIVADLHDKNPTWSPRRIHIATSESILKSLRNKYPAWNESKIEATAKEYLPSKSWIRDYITEVLTPNIKEIRDSGLDEEWHLGTLIKHPIPAEAIPYILEIEDWREVQPGRGLTHNKITIRQALWIGRLFAVARTIKKDRVGRLAWLSGVAKNYANWETQSQLLGEPPRKLNTDILDMYMWTHRKSRVVMGLSLEGIFEPTVRKNSSAKKEGEKCGDN